MREAMLARRPLIGVPGIRSARIAGLRRSGSVAADKVLEAVFRAGGEPLIVPYGPGALSDRLRVFDGIVMPGGGDLDPATYGAPRDENTDESDTTQDAFDIAVARAAVRLALPTLAICRGMQVLNVAMGGTLLQHLPDKGVWHRESFHTISVDQDSSVAIAMGGSEFVVSSYHHQAVEVLGSGLRVTGRAEDGCVEVIEHDSAPILAVQWHPEDDADTAPHQQGLFDAVVDQARSGHLSAPGLVSENG